MVKEIKMTTIKKRRNDNYPLRRDNYRDYSNAKWKWEDVLSEVDYLKKSGIFSYILPIARKYNIKYSTLRHKYYSWRNEKSDNKYELIDDSDEFIEHKYLDNIDIAEKVNLNQVNLPNDSFVNNPDNTDNNYDSNNKINSIRFIYNPHDDIDTTDYEMGSSGDECLNQINNSSYVNINGNHKVIKPKRKFIYVKDERGGHNRKFTEEEERSQYDYILSVFIKTKLPLDDDLLGITATKKYSLIHPDEKNKFIASKGWIYYFKKRWDLSTVIPGYSRIATTGSIQKDLVFENKCKEISKKYKRNRIFNMDETGWKLASKVHNVIAVKGDEHRKVDTNIDHRVGYTAIFIISADGCFLKPLIIVKGSSTNSLKKTGLKDDSEVYRKFTKSGWTMRKL